MSRHLVPLLGALVALTLSACSERSSRSATASTTSPAASATPTATTSSAPAPVATTGSSARAPQPLNALLQDPRSVPSAPNDRGWYFRTDDPATPDNEAARDLARVLASNAGLSESWAYAHLTAGGPVAIFVGGAGHEQDTPTRRSGWIGPYAEYVQRDLGIPALQLDYKDWSAGNDAVALATYPFSFREGVARTHGLIEKAYAAGVGEVRLYGHSKGGDIAQEVCWQRRHDARLTQAVALGIPVWCAALPARDPVTLVAGAFRLGLHGNRDYAGKLVVFIRFSDRSSRGELLPAGTFPGPGHEYKHVLAAPGFAARLDSVRFQEPVGYADRALGVTYDY